MTSLEAQIADLADAVKTLLGTVEREIASTNDWARSLARSQTRKTRMIGKLIDRARRQDDKNEKMTEALRELGTVLRTICDTHARASAIIDAHTDTLHDIQRTISINLQ